jgi:hypothetical protein
VKRGEPKEQSHDELAQQRANLSAPPCKQTHEQAGQNACCRFTTLSNINFLVSHVSVVFSTRLPCSKFVTGVGIVSIFPGAGIGGVQVSNCCSQATLSATCTHQRYPLGPRLAAGDKTKASLPPPPDPRFWAFYPIPGVFLGHGWSCRTSALRVK